MIAVRAGRTATLCCYNPCWVCSCCLAQSVAGLACRRTVCGMPPPFKHTDAHIYNKHFAMLTQILPGSLMSLTTSRLARQALHYCTHSQNTTLFIIDVNYTQILPGSLTSLTTSPSATSSGRISGRLLRRRTWCLIWWDWSTTKQW